MKMKHIAAAVCLLAISAAQAQSVNDLPAPGRLFPLERWMIANKIDADTAKAMRICEAHVAPADQPGAVRAFEPEWAASCTTARTKMYNAALATAAAQKTSDKALVDGIAAK